MNPIILIVAVAVGAAAGYAVQRHRSSRARRRDGDDGSSSAPAASGQSSVLSDAFLHAASHDMRTPIAAILGYEDLLAGGALGKLTDRAAEAVNRMGLAARQLLQMVDGYFTVAYADMGRLSLTLREIELAPIIREALETAQALASDYASTLSAELPDDLPAFRTDAEQLQRAMDLAFVAAVRASPGASMWLRAAAVSGEVEMTLTGTGLRVPTTSGADPPVAPRAAGSVPPTTASTAPGGQPPGAGPAGGVGGVAARMNTRLELAGRLLGLLHSELRVTPDPEGMATMTIVVRPCPADIEVAAGSD